MAVRTFALVFGIVFLLVGIAGFIPALKTPAAVGSGLSVTAGSGLLFGLFAVNVLHNIVHLIFGVWGVAAFRSLNGARIYAQSVAVIYAIFVVLGFIPGLRTVFGLVPLFGHDIWLHAILAIIAAYFGFVVKSGPPKQSAAPGA